MARFDSLKYPVHKLTADQFVDDAFPDLFKIPEFKKLRAMKNYNQVVKYIIFLYSKNTDLTHEYQNNLQARKDAAAVESGFVKVNDKWPADVVKIMAIENKDVTAAIFAYLKNQKHHIWTNIVVTEQELDEFQKLRFSPITKGKGKSKDDNVVLQAAKHKDNLMEACENRIKALENYYNQFFEDHTDVRKAEFDEMITPENATRVLAKMAEQDAPPN